MAEYAERKQAPPAVRAGMAASAGPVAGSPRVQRLVERAAALNGAPAPIQLNGDKKKSNNKKQEKIKAREAKKKKNKQRKEDELVRSYGSYTTDRRSEKEVRKAVRSLQAEGADLRKGHRTTDSSFKMNNATKGSMSKITGKLRQTEEDLKAKAREKDESDFDEDDTDFDDIDYEENSGPSYRRDDDDPPPPGGNQISAY